MWPDVSRYERGDNVLLLPSGSSAATRGLEGLRKGNSNMGPVLFAILGGYQ